MGQTQGGVRVRTLWLGKAKMLLVGARGTTDFEEGESDEPTKGQIYPCVKYPFGYNRTL
jgi:hypothetical protein